MTPSNRSRYALIFALAALGAALFLFGGDPDRREGEAVDAARVATEAARPMPEAAANDLPGPSTPGTTMAETVREFVPPAELEAGTIGVTGIEDGERVWIFSTSVSPDAQTHLLAKERFTAGGEITFERAEGESPPFAIATTEKAPVFVTTDWRGEYWASFPDWSTLRLVAAPELEGTELRPVELISESKQSLLMLGFTLKHDLGRLFRNHSQESSGNREVARTWLDARTFSVASTLIEQKSPRLLQVLTSELPRSPLDGERSRAWTRMVPGATYRLDYRESPGLVITPSASADPFIEVDAQHLGYDPSRVAPPGTSGRFALEPGEVRQYEVERLAVSTVEGCITGALPHEGARVVLARFDLVDPQVPGAGSLGTVTTKDFQILEEGRSCFELEGVRPGDYEALATQWIDASHVQCFRSALTVEERSTTKTHNIHPLGTDRIELVCLGDFESIRGEDPEPLSAPAMVLLRDLGNESRRAISWGFRWHASRETLIISGLPSGRYGLDVFSDDSRAEGSSYEIKGEFTHDFEVEGEARIEWTPTIVRR